MIVKFTDIEVRRKFDSYPQQVRPHMLGLRDLIFTVALANQVGELVEELRWKQPAYLIEHGTTIRIDWNKSTPDRLFVYFNCKTILLETFREIFLTDFEYYGNRALSLPLVNRLLSSELETCFLMAMRYHRIKKLPLLGYGMLEEK